MGGEVRVAVSWEKGIDERRREEDDGKGERSAFFSFFFPLAPSLDLKRYGNYMKFCSVYLPFFQPSSPPPNRTPDSPGRDLPPAEVSQRRSSFDQDRSTSRPPVDADLR